MKYWPFIILILLAACNPTTATIAPTSTPTPAVQPSPTSLSTETPNPTSTSESTPVPALLPTQGSAPEAETISIQSPDGLQIAGTFWPGHGPSPRPSVLLLHMMHGQRQSWNEFAGILNENGYSALAIDLRGHGDTGGGLDWEKIPADLAPVWSYLAGRPDVDTEQMAIIGASIGANLGLVAASEPAGAATPSARTVVLLSPGLSYAGIRTEPALENYGSRPLLIAVAEDDEYAADSSRKLAESAQGEAELLIYRGSAHGSDMLGVHIDLAPRILAWLDQHVRQERSASAAPHMRVKFTTEDGVVLRGTLYAGSRQTVIFSNMSDSTQSSWSPILPQVLEAGYTVLTYGHRGVGASGGSRSFSGSIADLQAVLDYAFDLGASDVIVVGASLGGMAAANLAATADLAGIVVISSPIQAPGADFGVSDETLAAIQEPKLFINTEGDRFAVDTQHMFEISSQPKEIVIYDSSAAHGTDIFSTEHGEALNMTILNFIGSNMRN